MATNLNYGSTLATDPLRTFRFFAEFSVPSETGTTPAGASGTLGKAITTGWTGGFTSISGLGINTQAIQYREGGYNTTVHQIPGMTTFNPVTFSRGVIVGNDQAMKWMRGLFAAQAGGGLSVAAGNSFRVNINIYVQNHPNAGNTYADDNSVMGFKLHNAWITNLNYTDLDATSGAILFETMTLVHEGLSAFFTSADGTPTDATLTNSNI